MRSEKTIRVYRSH